MTIIYNIQYMKPQYSKYLCLTEDKVDIDYDKYNDIECDNNLCQFCGCKYDKLQSTYLHEKNLIIQSCYLCNLIMNHKKYYTTKTFLISSEMPQYKINKAIIDYWIKNDSIPSITEIDESAKRIPISTFEYANLITFDDEIKTIVPNAKVYFTDEVLKSMNIGQKFCSTYNKLLLPIYELSPNEIKTLKYLRNKKKTIELGKTITTKNNIANKINNANIKHDFFKSLLNTS